VNIVVLSGNLTRDPEVRHTPKGQAVCEAGLAYTEKWKSESGEDKERTSFFDLIVWGKIGEAFAKWHAKGSKAFVRGKLVQEQWQDKQTGEKKSRVRVHVEGWDFASTKQATGQPKPKPAAPQPKLLPTEADQPAEDDVPF
jgi:single-strand DNA-binding protein